MVDAFRRRLCAQRAARGQGGYLLMITLGLLLFFSLTIVAVLSMTITAALATSHRVQWSEDLRLADSALDEVLNARRIDRGSAATPTVVGVACPASTYNVPLDRADGTAETVVVGCTGTGSTTGREMVLTAKVSGQTMGMASLRLDDTGGPGENLLICDWQLGATATAVPATC